MSDLMQFILIDNLIFGFLVTMSICIKPYVTNYCIAIVLKLLVLTIAAHYSLKYVNCSEGEFVAISTQTGSKIYSTS